MSWILYLLNLGQFKQDESSTYSIQQQQRESEHRHVLWYAAQHSAMFQGYSSVWFVQSIHVLGFYPVRLHLGWIQSAPWLAGGLDPCPHTKSPDCHFLENTQNTNREIQSNMPSSIRVPTSQTRHGLCVTLLHFHSTITSHYRVLAADCHRCEPKIWISLETSFCFNFQHFLGNCLICRPGPDVNKDKDWRKYNCSPTTISSNPTIIYSDCM